MTMGCETAQVSMTSECDMTKVVIKNTFIEHVLPKHVQRRCMSVPSSARLNNGIGHSGKECPLEFQRFLKGAAAEAAISPVSDASTDSGATSDDESVDSTPTNISTTPQTMYASDVMPVLHMQQMVLVAIPVSTAEAVAEAISLPIAAMETAPVQKTKLSAKAKAFTPTPTAEARQQELLPVKQVTKQVTKLTTEAKAFTPGCCLQQKPPGTKLNANARKRCARFRWQCQEVVLAARDAITRCMLVQSVIFDVEKSSVSLDVHMQPESFHNKDVTISRAKQALLESAEQSQGVYVMGYRSKPFLATSEGFFVILGVMTCAKEACWDIFGHGNCRNEGSCTLQHPVYQMPVYVNIKCAFE